MDHGIVANGNQANEDPSHGIDKIVVVILLMHWRYCHPQGTITYNQDEHPTLVLRTTRCSGRGMSLTLASMVVGYFNAHRKKKVRKRMDTDVAFTW
jgi:hypothetical protein